ncbi:hypothetical protein [Novosphingobium gossypii]|uniref:hypothetical protein n=1 Tax=Novosphingobium gossypii TaxID=1604774 RepID=UPI003D201C2A
MADSHEQADALLADVTWWFKGYRAGAQQIEAWGTLDPTDGLGTAILGVREWIGRLARGKRRVLGISDRNLGVAMTEAEFERLHDGLREHSGDGDRALARETIELIYREFVAERREPKNDGEIPF